MGEFLGQLKVLAKCFELERTTLTRALLGE